MAAAGKHRSHGLPAGGGLVDLAGQLGQALVGAAQLFQLGFQAVTGGGKLFHGYAVLAGQVVQPAEPAFDVFKGVRVAVQVVLDPVQLGKRFVQLDAGGIEHGVDIAKPGVVLADPAQLVPHLLQQGQQGRAVLVAIEQAAGALAGLDQGG